MRRSRPSQRNALFMTLPLIAALAACGAPVLEPTPGAPTVAAGAALYTGAGELDPVETVPAGDPTPVKGPVEAGKQPAAPEPECRNEGKGCAFDSDCCSSFCGEDGQCARLSCRTSNEACGSDQECCSGVCAADGFCSGDWCQADEDPCSSDDQCCSGICDDGVCGGPGSGKDDSCLADNQACHADDECCSSFCDEGVCSAGW